MVLEVAEVTDKGGCTFALAAQVLHNFLLGYLHFQVRPISWSIINLANVTAIHKASKF